MVQGRQDEIRDGLADSDVFGALTDEELDRLIGYGTISHCPAGRILFQRGDPGEGLFIVLKGRIKISSMSPDGKEAVLNFIEPGQCLGEIGLFDGKARSADATAIEPCELFVLRRAEVVGFIEQHPEIAWRVIGVLCARLRRTTEMMEDTVLFNMAPRIARSLLRLARDHGRRTGTQTRIELKLSQRELGGYVGLARENINRQLSAMRHDGIISIEKGHIIILDWPALERLAEAADLDDPTCPQAR